MRRATSLTAIVGAFLALALVLAACGGDEEEPAAADMEEHAGGATHVSLKEWSITPMEGSGFSAPAGDVTFEAHNDGTTDHELVIFKTDLAEDALPVEGGAVNEEGEGLELIGEIEEFPAGEIETGTFNLEAGNYVLICNLPAHYEQGMHATLTVE